jgi:hypothetical protein
MLMVMHYFGGAPFKPTVPASVTTAWPTPGAERECGHLEAQAAVQAPRKWSISFHLSI